MKETSIFDLNIGFLARDNPWDQIPRPTLLHPSQHIRKLWSNYVFLNSLMWFGFTCCYSHVKLLRGCSVRASHTWVFCGATSRIYFTVLGRFGGRRSPPVRESRYTRLQHKSYKNLGAVLHGYCFACDFPHACVFARVSDLLVACLFACAFRMFLSHVLIAGLLRIGISHVFSRMFFACFFADVFIICLKGTKGVQQ